MGFAALAVTTLSSTSSEVSDNVSNTIDQVGNTASLINQYGPTVVILAVFLLIFISIMAFILRSNHNMNKQMLESQQSAATAQQKMMQDKMAMRSIRTNEKMD